MRKIAIFAVSAALAVGTIMSLAGCGTEGSDNAEEQAAADHSITEYINEDSVGEYTIAMEQNGPLIQIYDNETSLAGALNVKGELVIPCEYESIDIAGDERYIVWKDEKAGVLDLNGKVILPCEFTELDASLFEGVGTYEKDGLAVAQKEEGGLWGYISLIDGSWVMEPQFQEAGAFNGTDMAPVKFESGKWGYIDRTGRTVIEPQFDEAYPFGWGIDEDAACVKMEQEDGESLEGLIDRTGSIIIPCKYDWVMDYRDGLAIVSTGGVKKNICGVIDLKGNEVIPIKTDPAYDREIDFIQDKLIRIIYSNEDGAYVRTEYYDRTGKKQTGDDRDKAKALEKVSEESPFDASDKMEQKRYKELKKSGKYTDVWEVYDNGLALVQVDPDGLWGLIDQNGEEVTEFVFNTEQDPA